MLVYLKMKESMISKNLTNNWSRVKSKKIHRQGSPLLKSSLNCPRVNLEENHVFDIVYQKRDSSLKFIDSILV